VGADCDGQRIESVERRQGVLRDPQLGRGAAPEQIAGRCRHDDHVRREIRHARLKRRGIDAVDLGIEDRGIVSGIRQQRPGIAVFERQMRLPAAEIDAAVKRPGRIDECDFHAANVT